MAERADRALQHRDAIRRGLFLDLDYCSFWRDTPVPEEGLHVERRAAAALEQVQRDVETDSAHADDRHLAPGLHPARKHVDIARDLRMLDSRDLRQARMDAGSDDHLVESG